MLAKAREHLCDDLEAPSCYPVTRDELRGVRALLLKMDSQRSIVDRVMGFFSFVNIIWVVSIVGVVMTVGPFLAHSELYL